MQIKNKHKQIKVNSLTRAILLLLFIFLFANTYSQQQYHDLDYTTRYKLDRKINSENSYTHTGFKPILQSQINFNTDSLIKEYGRDSVLISQLKHPVWWKKFRTEDLLIVDKKDFYLTINPLFNLAMGNDNLDSSLSINTRGISIKGSITKQLSFKTDFYENQAFFPKYISNYSKEHNVIPGQGRLRGFKGSGFDFAHASGSISFTPLKWLNFDLGHGKHFIGEGYRSLLLSDNAFNYPYFKITTNFKKFQYVYMLTAFQRASNADTRLLTYQRTHGSFLFLNYIFNEYLQVGLFEGLIAQTVDSTSNNNFTPGYFNPFILGKSIQYGFNDNNNVLIGLTAKVKITKGIQTYGQFMLDDDVDNKYGYQVGVKFFNLFSLKNLYFQSEYNWVRPYSYAHTNQYQNYSYYNQPLAHTIGGGFAEFVGVLSYRIKDFIVYFKVNHITTATDELLEGGTSNYGIDIFKPDETASLTPISDSNIGDGNKTERIYYNLRLSYLVNPVTNFQIYFEYTRRQEIIGANSDSKFFYFGIRTQLNNHYYDL